MSVMVVPHELGVHLHELNVRDVGMKNCSKCANNYAEFGLKLLSN